MEILIRVDTGPLRRCPGSGINTRRDLPGLGLVLPVHKQGDRVLCLRDTAELNGRSCGGTRGHANGGIVVANHGVADINMVAVKVVGDITLLAGPGLEGLELELGLAHVGVEVVEVAEILSLCAGIGVGGVEALVVLHEDEDVVFARGLDERDVFGEGLDGGLGDEYVDTALDGVHCNGEVGWVGCENCDGGAFGESVDGGFVGVGVGGIVGGEGGEGGVEVVVNLGDVFVEVVALSS